MAFNIFRPLSQQEKIEMSDIRPRNQKSILNNFCSALADINKKYQKSYRPFDSYSARQDFEMKMKNRLDEIQKTIDPEKIDTSIDFGDLDKYADTNRFEYVKRTEVISTRLVIGIKQEVHIGYRFHFKGEKSGNRISMFVPNADLEKVQQWINKTYNVDIEKEETKIMRVDEVPTTNIGNTVDETLVNSE